MTSAEEAIEARIDALLAQLEAASPDARAAGEELVAAVVQLHTPVLDRLVATVRDRLGADALRAVAADPAVSGVLLLHGLHPVGLRTRVEQGLERVRPTVAAHKGTVELVDVDHAGVAHLRLGGTCDGCPSSTATLHGLIEASLFDVAPDLAGVVVDGEREAAREEPRRASTVAPPSAVSAVGPVPLPMPTRKTERTEPREPDDAARCQLCLARIGDGHDHAVDVEAHTLVCVCQACALLLGRDGASRGRFRMTPRRVLVEPGFAVDDLLWDRLGIPVSVVFFFESSPQGRVVALYPSPAGATESVLALDAWDEIRAASRLAASMRPDVEALLMRRADTRDLSPNARSDDCFLVPVDRCYELVGLLRTRWRGLDGGDEARRAIDEFFDSLRVAAEPCGEVLDA